MHLFIWKINNSTIFPCLSVLWKHQLHKSEKKTTLQIALLLAAAEKIYMAKAEVFICRYKTLYVISQSKTFLRNIRYKKTASFSNRKRRKAFVVDWDKKSCKMPQIVAVETFDSLFVQVGNVHGHGKICYWKRTIFSVFGFLQS